MDAVISSVQENPLYLGILIGMGALLLVSLAKQLIKMALLTAICLAGMFFFVHSQAPDHSGLDKLKEALRENVPDDLGDRIREESKKAAAGLADKSKDVAESLAERIADAADDSTRKEIAAAADQAKASLKQGAEKAGEKVREITEKVREKLDEDQE